MRLEPLPLGLSPEKAALALHNEPEFFWLDSNVAPNKRDARFSFMGANAIEVQSLSKSRENDWISVLRNIETTTLTDHIADISIPRWVGYISFDAALPGLIQSSRHHLCSPSIWFARYEAVFVFDHQTQRAFVAADNGAACERAVNRVRNPVSTSHNYRIDNIEVEPWHAHDTRIRAALERIAAGDVYEINLTRRWRASFTGNPFGLWTAMRTASAVPLGFYLSANDHVVLSRTMERFLNWQGRNGILQTSPIKGTVAGTNFSNSTNALLHNPKEHAEHTMVVDLMRNDLGKVAVPGSVQVTDWMRIEAYEKLSHLVSTVSCRTRSDVGLTQIMEATFPPGSVTGTPKQAAIELIDALESTGRGLYTGCVGYIDNRGGANFAVTIRTAIIRNGLVDYFAGGGIVADSIPNQEIEETHLKAQVFFDAVNPELVQTQTLNQRIA